MANIKDLFESAKIDPSKLIGDNNFFKNQEELTQFNKQQDRFLSNIDYSNPSNFVKFGSAEEYYKTAIAFINNDYPFDKPKSEKLKWVNDLNDFEFYLFSNQYPKYLGYLNLSSSQWIKVYPPTNAFTSSAITTFSNISSSYFSNANLNFKNGICYEFWLKNDNFDRNTNILKINHVTSSGGNLGNSQLFNIYLSNSDKKFYFTSGSTSVSLNTTASLGNWTHYAFNINTASLQMFVNGQLTEEKKSGFTFFNTNNNYDYKLSNVGVLSSSLFYSVTSTGSYSLQPAFIIGSGNLVSLDECRLWTETRTPEEIGRNFQINVDGNDFSDPNNNKLLFYYKFNDGSETNQDICLDSSGYNYYGLINSFNAYSCRASGSAINSASVGNDLEEADPILETSLSNAGTLKTFYDRMVLSGSVYDELNIHSLYKKFPSWILEDEQEQTIPHLKQIIQIVSTYFDDLYNKITEVSSYKHINYQNDTQKIYPFYDKILTSTGFDVTELFSNLDSIEKIASRTEQNVYDEDVKKVKNAIFQNIYNNLTFILKSKGTEKAIKSFLKAYGVNENLVRINLYADNAVYDSTSKSRETVVKKKTILLKDSNSIYLSSSAPSFSDNFTFENSLYFDKSQKSLAPATSSLFGFYAFSSSKDQYHWDYKGLDFDVRLLNYSDGQVFALYTGSTIVQSSSKFTDIYDNSVWNLSLRLKPNTDSVNTFGAGASRYANKLELYACNYNSLNTASFTLSNVIAGALMSPVVGSKYAFYVGARKTNLTGSTLFQTNFRSLYSNYWDDYLSNEVINAHNKDITNYGVDQ